MSPWLGHSTAKLTLVTYGHLMGTDAERAALGRVNKALWNPAGTQRPESSEPETGDEA